MSSGPHKISRPFLSLALIALACLSSALAGEDYDYDADIAPILEQYCVKCHGPEKQKSKFRLDSYERLMRGGSSEEAPIIPYQPMQSPMLEYLLLPKSDEYAMPPEDEDSPSPEEILKIAHWIYFGARSKSAERDSLPLEEERMTITSPPPHQPLPPVVIDRLRTLAKKPRPLLRPSTRFHSHVHVHTYMYVCTTT